MPLLVVLLISVVAVSLAYAIYAPILVRLFRLDPEAATPAVQMRDDIDFVPTEPKFLMSQHFSAIAAAGPIVGPILAGITFGWLPALIWILFGSILIGGVHDLAALTASIRHKARSIAEVVREHMNRRSYVLFLLFVWIALVYIIVAFTDATASSFHGLRTLENGEQINGGGIATSSLMYLALPIAMGVLLRYTKLSLNMATAIFLPLVAFAIVAGQWMPFDFESLFGMSGKSAQKSWNVLLLVYCVIASVLPMWLLLQPRGHLGGYFLYAALGVGAIGILFGGHTARYPMWTGKDLIGLNAAAPAVFPMLFITIACGACSGFHSIIASGTTSKQLRRETDAKVIGYGAMLLEALVAVISLCCVMMLAPDSPLLSTPGKPPEPNLIYAQGIGGFMSLMGIPVAVGVSFGLMAFTTFVYDTLDVCTRLGRYILQELTGAQGAVGKWLGTILTAGVPMIFLIWEPTNAQGQPAWKTYWNLFGASNQLLAALTLVGVTVWLWRTYAKPWVFLVTGLPGVFMYCMSMWALARSIVPLLDALRASNWAADSAVRNPVGWVAAVLVTLGAMIFVEAIIALASRGPDRSPRPLPATA
jgi:carbon starvation protein